MESNTTSKHFIRVSRISTVILLAVVLTLLVGGAGVVFAQNLLTNPDFNGNLNGWNAYDSTYDAALDATGILGSGSAHDTYFNPAISSKLSITQCIIVIQGNRYTFGGKVFVPSQELNQTYASIGLSWFSNTDCNGPGFISAAIPLLAPSNSTGNWISLNSSAVTAPLGAQSASIIGAVGGVADATHNVNLDDMYIEDYVEDISDIPTMTQWGMIMFTILAGLGAIYYLRRKRAVL